MEREESSSTRSGSKVFGSERRQKRSSPPLWEKATLDVRERQRRAKHRTAEERKSRKHARRPVVFMRSPPHSTRPSGMTSSQQSTAATALASRIKSELRKASALVESTRAEAAQPSTPRMRNVIRTETSGETFSGRSARTVISRKSQGRERNRSVKPLASRSQIPPKYPASPPTRAANTVETRAAAGASSSEIRV